jgi:predicted nucleotidyltransferase
LKIGRRKLRSAILIIGSHFGLLLINFAIHLFQKMPNKLIILKELKHLIQDVIGDNLSDVIMFGSQAYGHPKKDSDYDVLIILKNDFDWKLRDKIQEQCFEISLKFGVLIDSKIISHNFLQNNPEGKHPLYQDAIYSGIHI